MGKKKNERKKHHRKTPITEAQSNKQIPPTIQTAINIIKAHPAVNGRVIEIPLTSSTGNVLLGADFEVSLPSRSQPSGVSTTGVQNIEQVLLSFPKAYPFKAPRISLRKNFNRYLPHIYPGAPDDFVHPCIYEGDTNELLHQGKGLNVILDQLSEWLKNAAGNRLINPEQGWEPIRRDEIENYLIYDIDKIRSIVRDKQGLRTFVFRSFTGRLFLGRLPEYTHRMVDARLIRDLLSSEERTPLGNFGNAVVIVCWPDIEHVTNEYQPETITSISDLFERARTYNCYDNLSSEVQRVSSFYFKHGVKTARIAAILCVRRPYNLIGDNSPIELMPYLLDCQSTSIGGLDTASPVKPLGHRHLLTVGLLRQMSGTKQPSGNKAIVQLGCGSLGSKIALHLARAGHGPFTLIDTKVLSPHNAARHALINIPDGFWQSKAEALKDAIVALGNNKEDVKAIPENVVDVLQKNNHVFRDARIVIDSTASLAVREYLSALAPDSLPCLFHTALYAGGELGVVVIEGRGRGARLDDLVAKLYSLALDDGYLSEKLKQANDPTSRQAVGQGCGSHTMVMPDTRISMFAASMAERARQIIEEGEPDISEIFIGKLTEDKIGVQWQKHTLGNTIVIKDNACNGWEVRILADVTEKIRNESLAAGRDETGGVLFGRISTLRKCVTIAALLPAPPNSVRTAGSFVLGTAGLRKTVQEKQEASGNLLTYVGTWHSHPMGGGPSALDESTFQKIKKLRLGAPSIMLIWSRDKFHLLFDHGSIAN